MASPAQRCGLCGEPDIRELFRKEGIPYFACRPCGFRFARPARNPNLANRLEDYEPAYLQYLQPDPADRANFDALYEWVGRFAPLPGVALLDVGCGSGKLVRYLRERGVDARGLEPSSVLHHQFLSADEFFVLGTLDSLRASSSERFDVVTALDVVEHVEDPSALLADAAALLSPGGILLVSTPDVASWSARLLGRRWHYYNPYHLSYFDEQSMRRCTAPLGLDWIECARRGRHRSVGYLLRYLWNFVLRRDSPGFLQRLDALSLPINFFEVMYLCFRKTRD
jgi:SAM-dependent methyltransferase